MNLDTTWTRLTQSGLSTESPVHQLLFPSFCNFLPYCCIGCSHGTARVIMKSLMKEDDEKDALTSLARADLQTRDAGMWIVSAGPATVAWRLLRFEPDCVSLSTAEPQPNVC